MYLDFFNLRSRPFKADLADVPPLLDQGRRDALAHLEYGLGENLGFIILSGEIGAGKTTLLGRLAKHLPPQVAPVFVPYAGESFGELLADVTDQLVRKNEKFTGSRIQRLKAVLRVRVKQGKRALVIIDDAQNLDTEDLKRICMLANLRLEGRLGMQFLLSGQRELREKLTEPELAQLAQRVAVSCHLDPLDQAGTIQYVLYRLKKAGASSGIFTRQAMVMVHKASRGVPRLINILCETALVYAFAEDSKLVTTDIMRQAIMEKKQELSFYFNHASGDGRTRARDEAEAQVQQDDKEVLEKYLRETIRQERERSDELLSRCVTLETQVKDLEEKLKRAMDNRRASIREIKLGG